MHDATLAGCHFVQNVPKSRCTAGVKLQLFTGDTPMGALLVLADSPVETILQDSVFYRLPAPALAVVNSSVRLNNTEVRALPGCRTRAQKHQQGYGTTAYLRFVSCAQVAISTQVHHVFPTKPARQMRDAGMQPSCDSAVWCAGGPEVWRGAADRDNRRRQHGHQRQRLPGRSAGRRR